MPLGEFNQRGGRKPKDWEEPYVAAVRSAELQSFLVDAVNLALSSYQGGGSANSLGSNIAAVALLKQVKDTVMALSAQVQNLVDQVAASKSAEASSAASLAQLVTQSAALKDQVAAAVAAAGTAGMSAEDSAAIVQATTDLHDSAAALADAAPKNVEAGASAEPIAPAAPEAAPGA